MLIGEVHTGLLQHSTSLPTAEAVEFLSLVEGANVTASQRPGSYVVSPDLPVGVDCMLPSASRRKVRCVGATLSRAVLSGGRVVQTSAAARVEPSAAGRRLPWSHYIAQVGRLEAIGRTDWADVVAGFLQPARRSPFGAAEDTLSLGGIAARLMDAVQGADRLDRRAPLRTQRTRLRWTVMIDEQFSTTGRARFTVGSDGLRTVELELGSQDAAAAQQLCEDLALHDWLLTTVTAYVESVASSRRSVTDKAARLRPVVEHLLHLWMPGARVSPQLSPVWDVLEQRPGFTRQWNSSVNWIRDQLTSGTMALLENAR
ncbi:SCO2521 family protein [Dactylosporangium sp. CS-047395]|uniref:SCO2521 family protein n=1 Tax=Dactylosporangium sp. CS-047395 TaxID=3239936 RepID=UPI003D8E02F8